jgi:hypothetical protein
MQTMQDGASTVLPVIPACLLTPTSKTWQVVWSLHWQKYEEVDTHSELTLTYFKCICMVLGLCDLTIYTVYVNTDENTIT